MDADGGEYQFTVGRAAERARIIAILDQWQQALGRLYVPLVNRVNNPDYDPRNQDEPDEDLLGF